MASCLTDEVRAAHYDQCRLKKKRCESILSFCMKAVLLIAVFTLLPAAAEGLLFGLFIGDFDPFLQFVLKTLAGAATVYTIYLRNWKITLGIVFVSAVMNPLTPLFVIPCVFAHRGLNKLEQEPGWPLFDVSFSEWQERQKNLERITRHKAIQLGEAAASCSNTGDMDDLLDENRHTLPAFVSGYHDRYRDSDPNAQPAPFVPGIMEELEEIGGPIEPSAPCTPDHGEQIR